MGKVVQLELFRVTAADPPWRDNRDVMEFPFLSLQKKRTKPIEFKANGVSRRKQRHKPSPEFLFEPFELFEGSIWRRWKRNTSIVAAIGCVRNRRRDMPIEMNYLGGRRGVCSFLRFCFINSHIPEELCLLYWSLIGSVKSMPFRWEDKRPQIRNLLKRTFVSPDPHRMNRPEEPQKCPLSGVRASAAI